MVEPDGTPAMAILDRPRTADPGHLSAAPAGALSGKGSPPPTSFFLNFSKNLRECSCRFGFFCHSAGAFGDDKPHAPAVNFPKFPNVFEPMCIFDSSDEASKVHVVLRRNALFHCFPNFFLEIFWKFFGSFLLLP